MQRIVVFFMLIVCTLVNSQSYEAIKDINKLSGLPSDHIYTVDFDENNYAWICTENGISKYNGFVHKIFNTTTGLPTNDIFEIHIDSKNRKWLRGFYDGICYIENDSVKKVEAAKNISSFKFFYEYHNSYIFISNGKCYILNNLNEFKEIKFANNYIVLDFDKKNGFVVVKDFYSNKDYLYFIKTGKMLELPKDLFYNKSRFGDDVYFSKNYEYFIDEETEDVVLDELFIYSNGDFRSILNLYPSFIKSIRYKGEYDEKYRVCYDVVKNCYHIFEKGKLNKKLSKKLSLIPFKNERIQRIYLDNDENFWIGFTDFNLKYIPKDFTKSISLNFEDFLTKNKTLIQYSILLGNKIYFTTFSNSLFSYNITTATINKIKDFKHVRIPFKLFVENDNVYVDFLSGIEVFKINENGNLKWNEYIKIGNRLIDYTPLGLVYSRYGNKVFNEEDELFELNTKIRINRIESSQDYIFVSNEEKVFSYNIATKAVIENPELRFCNVIYPFNKRVLIGTLDGQVYLLNEKLKVLNKLRFFNDKVTAIYQDKLNHFFYVGVGEKLYILKIENDKLQEVKLLGQNFGLTTADINSISSNESQIIIVNSNEINLIDKKSLFLKDKKNVDIEINNIRIDNKTFSYVKGQVLNLNRNQNSIVFETSIKSFFNDDLNYKKFIALKKEDELIQWKEVNENIFSFNDLSPGNYTFLIKIVNNEGLLKSTNVSFSIQPYFWETIFFKIFLGLLLVAVTLLSGYLYRYNKIKKDKLKMKLTDFEMKALKAQMNPHFIFNSLNNIQSTMIFQGVEKFNSQMVSFSKLLRKTLDIVNRDSITLQDEIEYIKAYVAIENMRLEPQINLTFEIDNALNLKNTTIPVMFLQPIVENAIIHGLSGISTNRKLIITMKKSNGLLVIEIENNGVGRDLTQQINAKKTTSYATKILVNRMKLYKELTRKHYSFEIIDLKDENLKSKGTKVILNIPII